MITRALYYLFLVTAMGGLQHLYLHDYVIDGFHIDNHTVQWDLAGTYITLS